MAAHTRPSASCENSMSADRTRTSSFNSSYAKSSTETVPNAEATGRTTSSLAFGLGSATEHRGIGKAASTRPRTGVSTLGVENQEIICAVSESRGVAPVVGLSFINLDTGEAVLSQISDSQTYVKTVHKLAVFNPSTILMVSSALDPKTKLCSIIEDSLESLTSCIQPIDRRYFSESSGLEYIQTLSWADDVESIKTAVSGKYFAVCCFAAALKFIDLGTAKAFQPCSLRIRYQPSEGSMMIDLATIRSLELVQNLYDSRSKHCLFGILNETLTPMGARLLRSNVLQPLTNVDTLHARFDAVEELSTKEDMFFAVRRALKPFPDADKNLTQLILVPRQPTIEYTEQAINNVIILKHFTQLVPPVFEALAGAQHEMLCQIRDLCRPAHLHRIQELIDAVLNHDTAYASKPLDLRNQRTHAVKAGINGLLDVARQTYKESMADALAHISEMAEEHGIQLQTKFNNSRHFYLSVHATELENRSLPAVFINVFRRRSYIECQTLELLKRNQKIIDSHNEVLLMSNQAVQDLIADIRPHMPVLFKVCEAVAMLDMLSSFAYAVASREYTRPTMDANNDVFAVQSARHPIREQTQMNRFVPNDIYSTPQTRFQIITGCNMSGKSTYIRTVALLTVMAQTGSFVPAAHATLLVTHQLFTRVSSDAADEHVEANVSTFAAEMREAAFILRNVGSGGGGGGGHSTSLVLVDELGRGTSSRDGLAIALAIAEALVQSRARVWFATHFRELALVLAERSGVVNLHLAARLSGTAANESERMEMLYRVAAGAVAPSHYGLQLAKLVSLPPDVLAHAEVVSRALEERMVLRRRRSPAIVTARRRKLVLNLKEHLQQAHHGKMCDTDLSLWLQDLQHEFVKRMTELDEEDRGLAAECDLKAATDETTSGGLSKPTPFETMQESPEHQETRPREVDAITMESASSPSRDEMSY